LFGIDVLQPLQDMVCLYKNSIHKDDKQKEIDTCSKFISDYKETSSTIRIFNKPLNEYRWMVNKRTVIQSEDNTNGDTNV
jgi:hypothetical protein